jgi:TPP-dependent pyruvate/acetoin dehydrogenase alpha subunit
MTAPGNYLTGWLLGRWEIMRVIRRTEEIIGELVECGEVRGPCHLSIGQEAVAAGVCAALEPRDTIWGGHRSHGHYLAKGGSLEALLAEILGKTTGCSGGRGGSMHLIAPEQGIAGTVPIVAATVSLAAGAAMKYKMCGESSVAVSFLGDGAMEEGQVHESMNLAALYRLPVLFVCENNLYSSHLHWRERRVADNLDRAGELHSIPGDRVDGNDVLAVYQSARKAVKRARAGKGPGFLECRTFRWRGHVGASRDLDVGVRRRDELDEWLARDPLRRAEATLIERGVSGLAERGKALDRTIERALQAARAAPEPEEERAGKHVWHEAVCEV